MAENLGLPALIVQRKTGNEEFLSAGVPTGHSLLEFWQWSISDLVSNATRGRLAEFIIASALGLTNKVRNEWDAFDLEMPSGLKIEIKSAAYLQTWFQKSPSSIVFSIRPTRAWTAADNQLATEIKRQADVYIFALLAHHEKSTLEPLNLDQWHFYPVLTTALEGRTRSQHSITLKSLEQLCAKHLSYSELGNAIREIESQIMVSK